LDGLDEITLKGQVSRVLKGHIPQMLFCSFSLSFAVYSTVVPIDYRCEDRKKVGELRDDIEAIR
jgi:hypothetical protein